MNECMNERKKKEKQQEQKAAREVADLGHVNENYKAASYSKQKYLPGNVFFWRFDIVLRLNRELSGV